MTSINSGIRYLASDIVKKLLETDVYQHDFMEDISPMIVTSLTGRPFKVKPKDIDEHLLLFKSKLGSVKIDSIIENRLNHNVSLVIHALGLPDECEGLLRLCTIYTLNFGLNALIDQHLSMYDDLSYMVAETLDITPFDLEQFTRELSSSGLFNEPTSNFLDILQIPRNIAISLVTRDASSFKELLKDCFEVLGSSTLLLTDFPYIKLDDLGLLLNATIKSRACGVNILLYGESGTGKTELSKLLTSDNALIAVKAKGDDFNISRDELNININAAHLRLQYHGLLQSLFQNEPNSVLLIDECEDIYYEYLSGSKISKERLHQTLTSNPVPTIWITNHIEHIPESCIRRFLYVLEIPKPPKNIKAEILAKPLKGLKISSEFKTALGKIDALAPAHVDNAANVAKTIGFKGKAAEHCIEQHIEQTLSACGYLTNKAQYQAEIAFDKRFINLTGDVNSINELIKNVQHFYGVRGLLLGPPGTGKTALVNYLAESLEQELITVKCSDVLGKYVGESEKNIAKIFKEARINNAIILLDEVDSLLCSRQSLTNQYETQLVNELLTQIDQCEQTIFAATNFSERLDKAVMRRFDFKLNLNYLTRQQTQKLYQEVVGNLSKRYREELSLLTQLTPGDFAIVARRNRLSKKALTDEQNILLLTEENNRKIQNQTIGFIHT
jgi:replication-associated recombination protein RarA